MNMECTKSDWKLFRELIPEWQEAYMERLNKEYIRLLSSEKDASEKFWALEKRIRQDKRKPGVDRESTRLTGVQTCGLPIFLNILNHFWG